MIKKGEIMLTFGRKYQTILSSARDTTLGFTQHHQFRPLLGQEKPQVVSLADTGEHFGAFLFLASGGGGVVNNIIVREVRGLHFLPNAAALFSVKKRAGNGGPLPTRDLMPRKGLPHRHGKDVLQSKASFRVAKGKVGQEGVILGEGSMSRDKGTRVASYIRGGKGVESCSQDKEAGRWMVHR